MPPGPDTIRRGPGGPGPARSPAERIPPQDIEAEAATLGSMLLEGEAAGLVLERLAPEDFYRSAHREIFLAVRDIYAADHQADVVLLRDHLSSKGKLEEVGGTEYIHSLATAVPSAANVEGYAKIVRDKAIARSLISAATSILRDAEGATDVSDILDSAEQRICSVANLRGTSEVVDLMTLLDEEFPNLERRAESPGLITGVRTDITRLDHITGGLQKSDLVILAARPSVGKTALALNWVKHVACVEKMPVLPFSLEMSKQQVALRLLCSHCKVPFTKLRSGEGLKDEMEKIIHSGMGELRESPILIDDTPSISSLELRAKARRMKSRNDIQMVVVDYLQLMRDSGGNNNDNREREVARISMGLKALGRELRVPVLALSQLRRGSEERRESKPQLSDLRESGALEQDADVVMLLHRSRDENGALVNETMLNVAKQRNGPTDIIQLIYEPQFMRFGPPGSDRGL
ncbi:MAG: replicative DNA helicase [Planctomycetota bacterium]|jgi:replicative DNA helicase